MTMLVVVVTSYCRGTSRTIRDSWYKYQQSHADGPARQHRAVDSGGRSVWLTVDRRRYCQLSWPTTVQFIKLWATTFVDAQSVDKVLSSSVIISSSRKLMIARFDDWLACHFEIDPLTRWPNDPVPWLLYVHACVTGWRHSLTGLPPASSF